jgi:hypothetical protein
MQIESRVNPFIPITRQWFTENLNEISRELASQARRFSGRRDIQRDPHRLDDTFRFPSEMRACGGIQYLEPPYGFTLTQGYVSVQNELGHSSTSHVFWQRESKKSLDESIIACVTPGQFVNPSNSQELQPGQRIQLLLKRAQSLQLGDLFTYNKYYGLLLLCGTVQEIQKLGLFYAW